MNRPTYRNRIGGTEIVTVPGWAVAIGAVMAGALGLAVFIASASLLLMLAPVVVGMAFYIRWRMRRALRKMAEAQNAADADIIDVEYRVIDRDQR